MLIKLKYRAFFFFVWRYTHHSPGREQKTSPSLPPASPRRLARPRQTGWSCRGGVGRSRAWPCCRGSWVLPLEAISPGWTPLGFWTAPRRGRPRSGTSGTESAEQTPSGLLTFAVPWQLRYTSVSHSGLLPSSGNSSCPQSLHSQQQSVRCRGRRDTGWWKKTL